MSSKRRRSRSSKRGHKGLEVAKILQQKQVKANSRTGRRSRRVRRCREEYGIRNRLLGQLGYSSYEEYLNSRLWRCIRSRQLRSHPHCFACGKKAVQVHHGSYSVSTLLGHDLDHLYSICIRCHEEIELTPTGRKRAPSQATKVLLKLRKVVKGHPTSEDLAAGRAVAELVG